ncbi:MAG: PD-(D/E)XK nuclease family transposase [Bacteroides sp.]|nr:PD-(D/E)XK nuclease family transposase [Bacteroides sp.]
MAGAEIGINSEKERLKNLAQLEQYRPLDDDFMRELFRNDLELAQFVLRIIVDRPDLILTKEETQYDLQHLFGERSVCLDVFGVDSQGQQYDIEVQRQDKGADPHRARYHSSAMDVDNLKANKNFNALPNTYVIFITENDFFGKGKAVYRIERMNVTTGEPFNDGEHIIYINGSYNNTEDTSELAKLIHDLRCSKADEMLLKPLAERMKFFKETPKGVEYMSKIMEDRLNERAVEKTIEIAYEFLQLGTVSEEDIAKATKLPLDKIRELSIRLKSADRSLQS